MKHKKIVFVCTGNTCRSPMAEAALRQELKRKKIGWYRVSSAGLATQEGIPMSENSRRALTEAGIPFDEAFGSHQLTERELREADTVICMTSSQHRKLAGYSNVTSFTALCGIEIPDPYGQGIEIYRATLRAIRACLPKIIAEYCPPINQKKGEES